MSVFSALERTALGVQGLPLGQGPPAMARCQHPSAFPELLPALLSLSAIGRCFRSASNSSPAHALCSPQLCRASGSMRALLSAAVQLRVGLLWLRCSTLERTRCLNRMGYRSSAPGSCSRIPGVQRAGCKWKGGAGFCNCDGALRKSCWGT